MIDIAVEKLVPLKDAAKLDCLPRLRAGKRIHVATLFRWATAGSRGIRLETLRVGGTRCTSVAALQRFFCQLTDGATSTALPSSHKRREREIEEAQRRVAAAGI